MMKKIISAALLLSFICPSLEAAPKKNSSKAKVSKTKTSKLKRSRARAPQPTRRMLPPPPPGAYGPVPLPPPPGVYGQPLPPPPGVYGQPLPPPPGIYGPPPPPQGEIYGPVEFSPGENYIPAPLPPQPVVIAPEAPKGPNRDFCGPFAGASFGYTASRIRVNYAANRADQFAHRGRGINFQYNFLAEIFTGVSYATLSGFVASGEILLGAPIKSDSSKLFKNEYLTITGKKGGGGSYGVLAKAGYIIAQKTILYLGVGGISDRWVFRATGNNTIRGLPNVTNYRKQRKTRLALEVGFEGYLCAQEKITWRATYRYVFGHKMHVNKGAARNVFAAIPSANSFIKYRPTDQTALIGIAYRF